MKKHTCFFVILTFYPSSFVSAGFIRHDQPLENYQDASLVDAFASAGYVYHPSVGYWHSGTLVSPTAILTSAHAFDPEGTGRLTRDLSGVRFGFDQEPLTGAVYAVRDVILHPKWPEQAPQRDLAIAILDRPVTNVSPARVAAVNPAGKRGFSVGYGLLGDGLGNFVESAIPRLAIEHELDYVGPEDGKLLDFIGQSAVNADQIGRTIRSDFDHPAQSTNSYGSSAPLTLEGALSTGDSGGPLYVQHNDTWFLTGVAFGSFNLFGEESSYGTINLWVPLDIPDNIEFLTNHSISVEGYDSPINTPEPTSFLLVVTGLVLAVSSWRLRNCTMQTV